MNGFVQSLSALLCVTACAVVHRADAQITKVANREGLASNTSIEWFAFGKDGAQLSTPVTKSFGGLKVEVASSSGNLVLAREGTTWKGDFTPGQYLLTQPNVSDNFLVSFNPPVSAVGMQIDPGDQQGRNPPYVGRFTARFCLYAADNSFLGMVQTQGNAGTHEDDSAKYLGARAAGTPIGRVSVQVTGVTPGFPVEGDLAFNRMDVVVPVGAQPASLAHAPVSRPPACTP